MDNQRKNVFLIGLYRIFSRMYFYLPIIFPLFYIHGETDLEIEILLAIYSLSIVFLSDMVKLITTRIGHKTTLIAGELFKVLGIFLLIFHANDFVISITAQLLMGLGYTFVAGNDTVILQQTFKDINSEKYQQIQAKTNSYMFMALLFSGLCGALFFRHNSTLILILSMATAFAAALCILPIKYSPITHTLQLNKGNAPSNKKAITYYCLTRGLILPVFVGILPYLFFVLMKIRMEWFAILISSFTLSGFISSKYLTRFAKKYTFLFLTKWSLLLIFVALALLLFKTLLMCFIATSLLGLLSGCVRPVTVSKINNELYSAEKTLKQAEFHYGIFSALILLLAGILLKYLSFDTYILILISLSAIYGYSRLFQQPKGDPS